MGALFDSVVVICMSVLAYLVPEYRAAPMAVIFMIVGARATQLRNQGKSGIKDSAALVLLAALGSLLWSKHSA